MTQREGVSIINSGRNKHTFGVSKRKTRVFSDGGLDFLFYSATDVSTRFCGDSQHHEGFSHAVLGEPLERVGQDGDEIYGFLNSEGGKK